MTFSFKTFRIYFNLPRNWHRMDFDEEDGPPELVETGDGLDEEETVKVPITIVTGTHILVRLGS